MEFGRQIQAGESLLVAFGAMILTRGVTVDGMWLPEGAFEGMSRIVSSHMILETSLVNVGSLNPLLSWWQPHRALLRHQLLLETELLSYTHPFVPSSVSSANPPRVGPCGWVA